MAFLPAFPPGPAAGARKAAGFRRKPGGAAWMEAPVVSGRILPVTPVPLTAVGYVGVCGRPLPTVICAAKVHSLKTAPLQPLSRAPPRTPAPVVYCDCTVN